MADIKKSLKNLIIGFKKTQPKIPPAVESMMRQQEEARRISEELKKAGVK